MLARRNPHPHFSTLTPAHSSCLGWSVLTRRVTLECPLGQQLDGSLGGTEPRSPTGSPGEGAADVGNW